MSETRFDVEVETLSAQLPFEGRSGILLGKPSEPVQPWPKDPPPEGRYYMRFAQSRPGTASAASTEAAVAVTVSHAARGSRFRVAAAESTLMSTEARTTSEQAATIVAAAVSTSTSSVAVAISWAGVSEVTGISQYRVSATESTLMNAAISPSPEQTAATVSTSLSASATRPSGVESAPTRSANVTSGTANLSAARQGMATASVSVSARRLK